MWADLPSHPLPGVPFQHSWLLQTGLKTGIPPPPYDWIFRQEASEEEAG